MCQPLHPDEFSKNNIFFLNADDSERETEANVTDLLLRRMTCTFGFCVCSSRSSKLKKMEEKHQPHLCIKTELGHEGVISCLQTIVPTLFNVKYSFDYFLTIQNNSPRVFYPWFFFHSHFGRFLRPSRALVHCWYAL